MRTEQRRAWVDRLSPAIGRCSDLPSLAEAVLGAVAESMPLAFGCLATTDPATGMITWSAKSRSLGVGDEEFAAVEYGSSDINSFAELSERQPPVGVLSIDTAGRLAACRRYREFLHPRFGFIDELRLLLQSRGTTWGALALYRGEGHPPFSAGDARGMAAASDQLAEAIQRCLFPQADSAVPGPSSLQGPAVAIIDDDDRVTHFTPAAQWAINELGGWDHGSLPTGLLAVAADARTRGGHSSTRARGRSGTWLNLRAAPLSGPPGRTDVVLTIELTPRAELSRLTLSAKGLTAREEDVALLVLQGANTRAIATALHLSPHTVQDHLKSIFAKLAVTSRREMIAMLVLD